MLAILSDIHGNLAALEAVLEKIEQLRCSRILSLGDVAGYHPQVQECIDLLRARNTLHLLGNHDLYLTTGTGCPRSPSVTRLLEFQRPLISSESMEWLRSSPRSHSWEEYRFVHGGWSDPIDEYIYTVSEERLPGDGGIYFSGHTHVQYLARFGRKTYCNPGAVGQPRDGDRRAAFAVCRQGQITLHRVEYDIDRTAEVMRRAGFEPYLWENLYTGAQIGGRIDAVNVDRLALPAEQICNHST
jgi:predicted phosphodiesterase